MRLYFAGNENDRWQPHIHAAGGTNVLISYHYLTQGRKSEERLQSFFDKLAQYNFSVFMDSGAYSAMTKGIRIDISEYVSFLKRFSQYIDLYANLDVIGDERATAKNQTFMEKKGLSPLPTFHQGSEFRVLKRMIDKYDYLALGNISFLSKKKSSLYAWLDHCFSLIRDKAKVHGFGMTGGEALYRYPFYSVDSTSWWSAMKQAQYIEFDGRFIRAYGVHGNKRGVNAKSIPFMDGSERGETEEKRYEKRMIHGIGEWVKFEKHLTRVWQQRGISF